MMNQTGFIVRRFMEAATTQGHDSLAVRCASAGALQIVLMIISISVSVLRANLAASSVMYMRAVRPKDFGLRLIRP